MLSFIDPETLPPAPKISRRAERFWVLFLLLAAAFLRIFLLSDVPPGLTHDEADHGLSAWGVVQGERPLYFTVGYGREPLYDYVTAVVMAPLGPTFFAQRFVAVSFGMLTLATAYLLVRKLTNVRVGLLTLAGLAFGFWPLVVARQALRTITLLPFFILAVYFWLYQQSDTAPYDVTSLSSSPFLNRVVLPWWDAIVAGVLLGLTFYTYLPARLMWLLLPVVLLWWLLTNRPMFWHMWRKTILVLGIACLVGTPLLVYLWQNPTAEVRIGQLTGPLEAARSGDYSGLIENVFAGFRTIALRGDSAWRYNYGEQPFLLPFFAALFGFGLMVTAFGLRKPASLEPELSEKDSYALLFFWLMLGLAPVLITGPYLSTTRAIGMMPVLYVYPAILLDYVWRRPGSHTYALTAVICLYGYMAADTAQTYFFDWANHPEVRLHHESALVGAVDQLNHEAVYPDIVFSVNEPGRFHDQPVGLMTLRDRSIETRWLNGSQALILPATPHLLVDVAAGLTLIPFDEPAVIDLLDPYEPVSDFDSIDSVQLYKIAQPERWQEALFASFQPIAEPYQFGQAITLLGYDILQLEDGNVEVRTFWEISQPVMADTVLFTQYLGPDGVPVAQSDRLDAPSNAWVAGDLLIQAHRMPFPPELESDQAPLVVGFYDQQTGQRWPVTTDDGTMIGDFVYLQKPAVE